LTYSKNSADACKENREIYEEFTRRIEEYQDSGPLSITSDEERVYYASKSRKHFHRPKCPWADYHSDITQLN